jgi:hypothetical protein
MGSRLKARREPRLISSITALAETMHLCEAIAAATRADEDVAAVYELEG